MAALAMVGTIFMGCVGEEMANEAPQTKTNNTVTQTTTISLDSSAGTRALDADGKKTFAKDDQIAILYKDANNMSQKAIATLKDTDISSDGKTAKITVTLDNPKASGQLRCIYPAVMLSGYFDPDQNPDIDDANTINYQMLLNQQDGTLATIASKYDLAVFDGTFTSDAELPGSITLKNQLAIVAFTIKDYDGNDITSTITNLEIDQGPGLFGYSLARTAAAGPIYVAMMPSENAKKDINITAFDGTTIYEKTAKDVTLAANSLYPVTATLADIQHTPLTLEATENDTEITVKNPFNKTFQYAKNGGENTTVEGTDASISLNVGDIVQFYSTNAGLTDDDTNSFKILPNKKTYVYGNVMSMIDDNRSDPNTPNFANDKTIGAVYALKGLFLDADNIAFHDTKDMILPATTLADGCYWGMFSGCTNLTTAPDLPATEMKKNCYKEMFYGCTKVSSVKCLATDISVDNCLTNWLNDAGTADGCKRILYVDPATNYSDNDWKLDSSGEDGKRWTTEKY